MSRGQLVLDMSVDKKTDGPYTDTNLRINLMSRGQLVLDMSVDKKTDGPYTDTNLRINLMSRGQLVLDMSVDKKTDGPYTDTNLRINLMSRGQLVLDMSVDKTTDGPYTDTNLRINLMSRVGNAVAGVALNVSLLGFTTTRLPITLVQFLCVVLTAIFVTGCSSVQRPAKIMSVIASDYRRSTKRKAKWSYSSHHRDVVCRNIGRSTLLRDRV
ncbi:hypothetical protein J6590_098630 [Homalodisca vitripennis]|nr:hypothetical protein J6590_096990 [Homalodisca vitripennis]KAG8255188.1 hypothetical protein J6590_098766 [Homalodisca vitripennis]KAG8274855.1 hypothetical protein J6590_098630 [Homalodisca vitripennis]